MLPNRTLCERTWMKVYIANAFNEFNNSVEHVGFIHGHVTSQQIPLSSSPLFLEENQIDKSIAFYLCAHY